MKTNATEPASTDAAFQPPAHCVERRMTNRLWACKVVQRNKNLDNNPSQCAVMNAYAGGAFKLLEKLAPNCAACRYR